ncbi:MAG: crosslink repair DNA glycosylase YcaQ family protein, partial [Polyangiales bacterium]
GFDEYMLGYKDRDAIIDPEHFEVVVPGKNGMFKPTIVDDGRVIGTWRAEQKKQVLQITTSPFLKLTAAVRKRLAQPAERYRRFLGRPTEVIIQ